MDAIREHINENQRLVITTTSTPPATWKGTYQTTVSEGIIIVAPLNQVERTVILPWTSIAHIVLS